MIEIRGLLCSSLQNDETYEKLYQSLSSYRKEKVDVTRTASGKIQRVASGYLLESMLSARGVSSPYEYDVSEVGKPFLRDDKGGVCFSLSHTNGLVVCAVSDSDVGIDVEPIQRYNKAIAHRFFLPEEWSWIEEAKEEERATRFYQIWTYKEAANKMIGEALPRVIREMVYPVVMDRETSLSWNWKSWIIDGYVITLCVREECNVEEFTFRSC